MRTEGCLNCDERHKKCHASCPEYKKFKEKNEKVRKDHQEYARVLIYQIDQKNRAIKERQKHTLWKKEYKNK